LILIEQPLAEVQTQRFHAQLQLSGFGGDNHVSPTQVLDEAAIENEDDDYWDVEPDEEMADIEDENNDNVMLASRDFNIIRRIHQENSNELAIRRHDVFLYDGLLTHYKPEYAASPLRNLKTARVFAHYIHVVSYSATKPVHRGSGVHSRTTYALGSFDDLFRSRGSHVVLLFLPLSNYKHSLTLSRLPRAYQSTNEIRETLPRYSKIRVPRSNKHSGHTHYL
jgi:hypothetical protein